MRESKATVKKDDALDELGAKIDALIERLRDIASERDELLAERDTLLARIAESEAAQGGAATRDLAWRERFARTASSVRDALDELRAG